MLARLAVRSGRSKDLEIIVLRHQLGVLRRQINRPAINDDDRTLLGAIGSARPRPRRGGWIVTPETLLRWHRRCADPPSVLRRRGSQFIDAFDETFRTEGLKILKTPVRTPVANAFAERWIGSIRPELLDRTIIWNQPQLEQLVTDYIDRYNTHRPHRSLDQQPPIPHTAARDTNPSHLQVVKSPRCDGLINEYRYAA